MEKKQWEQKTLLKLPKVWGYQPGLKLLDAHSQGGIKNLHRPYLRTK